MTPLVEALGVEIHFPVRSSTRGRPLQHRLLRAVDGVDLTVDRGVALGIVGESGCGKSTLARALAGLTPLTAGALRYAGSPLGPRRDAAARRRIQMVFQDPASSLNPRMKIGAMLGELLRVHELVPAGQVRARTVELLELVGLPSSVLDVTPRRLSGGQRQRIGIARALAVEPELLIADEAVSALDVSVQAAILNLFVDLRRRLDLTMLFISHDLAVVRSVCDRVAVMYLGRVVEEGPTNQLFADPQHPYTKALLAAAPRLHGTRLGRVPSLLGEPPSPLAVPAGCRFHPRCVHATDVCRSGEPPTRERGSHRAVCHIASGDAPSTMG